MRQFWMALIALLLASSVAAQPYVPEKRLVVSRDTDFPGGDLQPLFDTTLEACRRVCLSDPNCRALTFNQNSNACFPKTAVARTEPFTGALSARVVDTASDIPPLAAQRAGELAFLTEADLTQAYAEAEALGQRHGGGQWTVEVLLDAALDERRAGNLPQAIHWTGAALAQADSADLWMEYGAFSALHARDLNGSDQRRFRDRAFLASVNGYLRSASGDERAQLLFQMAQILEMQGRGALMIPALRLAESLSGRTDISALLDEAIGKYGFRVVDHVVESDLASPRLCAEFSEPLQRAGVDYASYVRLPDARLAVSASDNRLCVEGAEHGTRLDVTFRRGLPSASGEGLVRDVPITAYIRDRAPRIQFPGRAYVMPRSADAGLPIETVNLDQVSLTLRRISDRNLVSAIRDSYFGQPLNEYEEDYIADALAEEVWQGTGEVRNALNRDVLTRLPLGEMIAEHPAGIYALTAAVQTDPETRVTQWFLLTDIGLTVMQGTDGLTVFARSLADAAPLPDVSLSLINRANRDLAEVTTDAAGMAVFPPGLLRGSDGASAALVVARRGEDDMAFLSLMEPAFDLSDRGVAGRPAAGALDAFLTTDRGAYRAGETIHATALLRDARAFAVPDLPMVAVLTRPDGVEHSRHVSDGGLAGGHAFKLPLAASVPRGTWRLEVFADPNGEALAAQPLLVEDFVPERLDFDLALPDGPILPLAPPVLDVSARYLFGAPGAGLAAEGSITLRSSAELESFPGYRFGRHDDAPESRRSALPADLVTDAAGMLQVPLRLPEIDSRGRPMQAQIALRLSEASGRPVERRLTRPVAPSAPMIGIRPGFDGTLPEGAEARFDLLAVGADLSPVPMQVRWQLNRVTTRYQWYQAYGAWNWEPVTRRETIARGDALLGNTPVPVSAPVDWGTYELVAERIDGDYVAASVSFDAGWFAPANTDSPDMLEMSLDAPAYRLGQTAALRMVPRHAGAAQVSVLADRVIDTFEMQVAEGENTLSLPVTEAWGAGVYITAQVLRPMDEAAGLTPARAMGLAHAAVDPGARRLAVTLSAPEQTAPRGTLRSTVGIDGLAGQQAYVTVAAVDLGILNLTAFDAPDPAAHFFGQRQLGVDIRDVYGRLIDGMSGVLGQVRSGGDAQAALRMQSPPPTEALVAFFSGIVPVGPNGQAEIGFDLPDFNGTVRLMAMAWTADGVGQAQADVLVRDPVVMTASMPRFLAPGDSARLLLEMTHASGPGGVMPLQISAEGVSLSGAPDQVALPEGGKLALTLPLQAHAVGDHRISISLTTPDGQRLTKALTLGVRATDPPVSQTRRFTLAAGQSFRLDGDVFDGLQTSGAEALISAGPLARFDVPGLLAELERYPYGCTEQVTSKALPLLYLSSLAVPLGLGDMPVDRQIAQAIETVLSRQDSTGAFGLWRAGSGETWLDAYVTDFLSRARASGHSVPDRAFTAALDNLANRIAYAPDFDSGGEDIAYALMVLAREGRAQIGDLRYYADEKAPDFATPLALAQLGHALAGYGDPRRADRLFSQAAAALAPQPEEAQIWRADFGSSLRDRAGVLTLAVEARAGSVNRTELASGIVRPRSTQERAWALMAANAMVQDPGVSGLTVDTAPVAGPFLRRVPAAGLEPFEIRNTGNASTQITLTTLGVPEAQTDAGGFGYRLERRYYTLDGIEVDVTQPISSGTRLVTVLTVFPAEDTRARLMIDDALPAGFEIDNPALLQSGDLRGLDWLEVSDTEMAEFRTERFLAAVDQRNAEPIRLAYILRAVSPGAFHHPAALVEDMYRPEYRAVTASGRIVIE